jgi:hypothetical protein
MRIFAISDLHTDFDANWQLLNQLSKTEFKNDLLIVAGDIADRIDVIGKTLMLLRDRFQNVFYLPGNHELWVRSEKYHSIDKFKIILSLCHALNIETQPKKIDGIWIVPLYAWYSPWLGAANEDEQRELEYWSDFYFCQWPDNIGSAAEYFANFNLPNIRCYDSPVITFSHFLPRIELLPPRERLHFKSLARVAVCPELEKQIRAINPIIHIFGHSHINWDANLDGVRYFQNALSYPRERNGSNFYNEKIWNKLLPPIYSQPAHADLIAVGETFAGRKNNQQICG